MQRLWSLSLTGVARIESVTLNITKACNEGPRFAVALLICTANLTHASDTLTLANGDRLSGTLLEITAQHIALQTAHSGRIAVERAAVVRIDFDQRAETALLAAARGRGPATEKPATASQPAATIGRPEDIEDIRKLFLRQSSVLLKPGEVEVEFGAEYRRARTAPLGLDSTQRMFSLPLGVRVGLGERWQGYANLPLAYGRSTVNNGTDETSQHKAGIGDLSAGLNYQIVREGEGWADLVATAGVSAPTGRSPYADNGAGVALGSGHWAANIGLQFVKTEDPVAIYGGLGYTHQFARNGLGQQIKPGNALGYNLGLSFAINDRVSISGEFIGSTQGATRTDGVRVIGSAAEPMQFRSGLIYRASKDWYLAPTLTYGLNSDAPDVVLGISSSHRFK